MQLKKRIPPDFYKLFRTKNREAYMQCVTALYEKNNEMSSSFGLTREESCEFINDTIKALALPWEMEDREEIEEIDALTDMGQEKRQNKAAEAVQRTVVQEEDSGEISSKVIYNHLLQWGWIRSEYDERLNTDVISFPEYSQLFAEVFKKLQRDDDSRERESMLSVYSALFTYARDTEQNNDILRSALQTSRALSQLLSNMQDGMRAYFDELSSQKNFIGIQQVLVEELNNSDSRKYAILTTTDSFYRYKEAVKELVSQILQETALKKAEVQESLHTMVSGSLEDRRVRRRLDMYEEASQLVYKVEREFDQIERKYNILIEQKTVFAKRALARIHYILQEGTGEADGLVTLINLIDRSEKGGEILRNMTQRIHMSTSYRNLTDASLSSRRDRGEAEYVPLTVEEKTDTQMNMIDFVPRPLYTKKELRQFREKHTVNGTFVTTKDTVQTIEDLEKLMFLWQEETGEHSKEDTVSLAGEITDEAGLTYSRLIIHGKQSGKTDKN